MTDEPDDRAAFELVILDENGDEELAAATDGPREQALVEILGYFSQLSGQGERRLYEVTRIRVELGDFAPAQAPRIILPGDMK